MNPKIEILLHPSEWYLLPRYHSCSRVYYIVWLFFTITWWNDSKWRNYDRY